ncbi:MAG: hypothetical protein OEM52_03280 [bacterium]|nr:hypothetical protein [bacterium]
MATQTSTATPPAVPATASITDSANKKVKISIDAATGKTNKVVIVGNDTVADINISKSDTDPAITIDAGDFPHEVARGFKESGLDMVALLVPLGFFAACAFIVWIVIRNYQRRVEMQHEERMAAIEKGVTLPSDVNVMKLIEKTDNVKVHNPYKWPLILTFGGLALIVANMLQGDWDDFGFGLVLMAIGGALFFAHFLRNRERNGILPPRPPTPPNL